MKNEMYDRQIMAFGQRGQDAISKLKIAIVGAGGLGSISFFVLVRLGAKFITIIDHDSVEHSNLNRLYGSTVLDAKNKTPKVEMLKREAKKISQDIEIITIQNSILNDGVLEQVKNHDIIFGCTDTHSSRSRINNFAAQYLIPYFDTGTGIEVDENHNIKNAGGQVRISIPGKGCLNCIDGIDLNLARQEMLPEEERQIAIERGYINGVDVHAPAVASLNGVIANLAVTEFMAFVTGCKEMSRYVYYDFLTAKSIGVDFNANPNCFTCSEAGLLATADKGTQLPEFLIGEVD